jgi:hypothetical protein
MEIVADIAGNWKDCSGAACSTRPGHLSDHRLKGGPREQKNQHLDEPGHLRCIDRRDHMVSLQSP